MVSACKVGKTNTSTSSPTNTNSVSQMTVIQILPEQKDINYKQIIFTPSQRIYKLNKDANPKLLELLNESLKNNTPVNITLDASQSDLIINVERIK